MIKQPVSLEKIEITFKCPSCEDEATVTVKNMCEVGVPFCGECDCDMEPVYEFGMVDIS